jgi:primosomal protein N' (replication factor Y) (superfamily II helicase)
MRYALVALNVPINQTYTYHVSADLEAFIQQGHLVRVAFATSTQAGIVVGFSDSTNLPSTKPIQDILDPLPVVQPEHIALSFWLSEQTLTPIGLCLWLWLPPAMSGKSTRMVGLLNDETPPSDEEALSLFSYLKKNSPAKLSVIEKTYSKKALNTLVKSGTAQMFSMLSEPSVRAKTVRTAHLLINAEETHTWRFSTKQRDIVDYLAQFDYPQDVTEIYTNTNTTNAQLNQLAQKGVLQLGERIVYRDRLADKDFMPIQAPQLTPAQQTVWDAIANAQALHAQNKHTDGVTFLVHGVTGSGKTEIYLRAIEQALALGQQAIMLVPEIALTPQTIQRVATRFPEQVAVVHSHLSNGERYDTWQRARSGQIRVVVGTRSALFTPFTRLGLVILDEEHDSSYKQSPPIHPPYYHARAVAEHLMQLCNGIVILGSATPDLQTFYRAQNNDIRYLHLPNRIMGHKQRILAQAQREGVTTRYQNDSADRMMLDMPPVTVIDMREELKKGNTSMFSRALQLALTRTLQRGEQAILFLNRRGQASYVFCRDCGYIHHCERCDSPMTYHRQGEALKCHHCGNSAPVPTQCPNCNSTRIKFFGAGTQQVEQELTKLFPEVKSVRWDADTANNINEHEAILAQFANHEVQVMVGTQMIAKGLDLPMVTLVGVISADMGLAMPDFRTTERTFQLLTQVAGRAGRGVLGGEVILQTYQPQHESISAASHHDYSSFYQQELPIRRNLGYPPFRRLGRVLIQGNHPIETQRLAEKIANHLKATLEQEHLNDTQIIGPAPCFFTKIDNLYRWHVLVRSVNPTELLQHLPHQSGIYIDIDTMDVL